MFLAFTVSLFQEQQESKTKSEAKAFSVMQGTTAPWPMHSVFCAYELLNVCACVCVFPLRFNKMRRGKRERESALHSETEKEEG